MRQKELDLTTGNLFIKTFKFVIPLMMTTIFQLLYTTIDLWTVSKYGGGPLSMSAVGSNGALINLILTVLVSMSTGANVVISIAKGENNKEKAERILHTAFVVALIGGIIFAFLGFFLSPLLLRVMDTPVSIISKATDYLRIYFIGVPFLMIYNMGSQMLRALGDSKRPFYILVISGIINVLFDLLFVIVFKMDVKGVALATILSEAISGVLVLLYFKTNKDGFVRLSFKKLGIHKKEFNDILRVGLPAGLQGLAFSIPNVLIQSSLYTITNYSINGNLISVEEIVSGASASSQIEGYVFAMIDAFAVGIVSLAGQNFGARKKENIKKTYWYSVIWMLVFWLFSASLCILMPYTFLKIFIKDSNDIVVDNALLAGRERLYIMSLTYFLDGWMDINGCFLRGVKRSTPPAILTLIGCSGTRILFLTTIFKLDFFHTIFWLYAAFPISWILVNIVYIFLVPHLLRKDFKKWDKEMKLA